MGKRDCPSAADIATSIIWWQGLTDFLTKTVNNEIECYRQRQYIRKYDNGFLPCTKCGSSMVYLQNYCTNCGQKRG